MTYGCRFLSSLRYNSLCVLVKNNFVKGFEILISEGLPINNIVKTVEDHNENTQMKQAQIPTQKKNQIKSAFLCSLSQPFLVVPIFFRFYHQHISLIIIPCIRFQLFICLAVSKRLVNWASSLLLVSFDLIWFFMIYDVFGSWDLQDLFMLNNSFSSSL